MANQESQSQGQNQSQNQIRDDMEVFGSDDQRIGRVDHLDAQNTIKLAKEDPDSGGQHHWIPTSWVDEVEGDRVRLTMPRDEVRRQWRDQEPGENPSQGSGQP